MDRDIPLVVDSNEPEKQASIRQDLVGLLLRGFLTLLILYLAYNAFLTTGPTTGMYNWIIGLVFGLLGLVSLALTTRNAAIILHHIQASRTVGTYYHGKKPKCPFLVEGMRGFGCEIEFARPFDVPNDLPKCYSEDLFRQHILEKMPGVHEQALVEGDPDRKAELYLTLGKVGYPPAKEDMLALLRSELLTKPEQDMMPAKLTTSAVQLIIMGLAAYNDPNVLPDLLDLYGSRDRQTDYVVGAAIAGFGPTGVDSLLERLQTEQNPDRQYVLVDAVGKTRSTKALPVVEKLLESSDDLLRSYALTALGRIDGEDGKRKMFLWLTNESSPMGRSAIKGMLLNEPEKTLPTFFNLLLGTNDPDVTASLEGLLGEIDPNDLTRYLTTLPDRQKSKVERYLVKKGLMVGE